jgi:hypothetical protein
MLVGVLGNTNRLFGRRKATGKAFIALSSRRNNSVRTTETTITFRRPFTLSALDKAQPAGTYRVVTEEEEIDGLSFVAFRRTATLLHLPALATASATQQVVTVDPLEWTAIVEADGRN